MFAKESEMTASVARWMSSSGMTAKSEFVTPWGICDLVGVRFNRENVARRVELGQTRAVSSITRALLLLRIPDSETGTSITFQRLVQSCEGSIPEETVLRETCRLIADRFVVRSSRRQLQKINGWMPLQDRMVAVELKLSRIDEALRQALNNLGFADESYVALPADVAKRVAGRMSRWPKFVDAGVGLLSVTPRRSRVLVPARNVENWRNKAVQIYCVEKFWSSRVKGS
jgi:hypothetical protein